MEKFLLALEVAFFSYLHALGTVAHATVEDDEKALKLELGGAFGHLLDCMRESKAAALRSSFHHHALEDGKKCRHC